MKWFNKIFPCDLICHLVASVVALLVLWLVGKGRPRQGPPGPRSWGPAAAGLGWGPGALVRGAPRLLPPVGRRVPWRSAGGFCLRFVDQGVWGSTSPTVCRVGPCRTEEPVPTCSHTKPLGRGAGDRPRDILTGTGLIPPTHELMAEGLTLKRAM